MSDNGFDGSSFASTAIGIAITLLCVIFLLPAALDVAWGIAPGLFLLMLVWAGLMAIINRFNP